MPRRNLALPLVAVVALGGVTACEKQSPIVTVTAGGVVVTARATKYCRENGKCNESDDNPLIYIQSGDVLGIDVPRSLAEEGWRLGDQGGFSHDHYRAIDIGNQLPSGGQPQELIIMRDPQHGEGVWRFSVGVK